MISFIIIYERVKILTENISEEQVNNERKERRKKRKKLQYGAKFYCPFFTFILIFCLLQIGYGAVLNVGKIFAYQGKQATLENLLKKAQLRNKDLKAQKKVITSDNSLEGIARNNLKMAGQDEVLIIINKKVEDTKTKKKTWNLKNLFKKKNSNNEPTTENIYIPPEVVEE